MQEIKLTLSMHPPLLFPSPSLKGPIRWAWLSTADQLGKACLVEALQVLVDKEHPGLEPLSVASEKTRNRARRKLLRAGLIKQFHDAMRPIDHKARRSGPKIAEDFLMGPISVDWIRRACRTQGRALFAALVLLRGRDMNKEAIPLHKKLNELTANEKRLIVAELKRASLFAFSFADRERLVEPFGHRQVFFTRSHSYAPQGIIAIAFDAIFRPGEKPHPIAVAIVDIVSGEQQLISSLQTAQPPWSPDDLIVTWDGVDTLACVDALGWPLPEQIIDLKVEYRRKNNNNSKDWKTRVDQIIEAKTRKRTVAPTRARSNDLRGWIDQTINARADASTRAKAIAELWQQLRLPIEQYVYALHRGRYVGVLASSTNLGIPLDLARLERFEQHWLGILESHISANNEYGFCDGITFREARFADFLIAKGLDDDWPRTPQGDFSTANEHLKERIKLHPAIEPTRQILKILRQMSPIRLEVGRDGRNRCDPNPFGTKTGRDSPSSTRWILGLPRWARGLIRPNKGMALARIDFRTADFGIAAALSQDPKMMEDYKNDPHMQLAIAAGLAPVGATKESHPNEREIAKTASLALLYGAGEKPLASRLGISIELAEKIRDQHRDRYSHYYEWRRQKMSEFHQTSCRGWDFNARKAPPLTRANFPIQSSCAEILRAVAIDLVEMDIAVIALHHDAVWLEAPEKEINKAVASAKQIMTLHCRDILQFELETDSEFIKYPDRYKGDNTGRWKEIIQILEQQESGK